MSSTKINSLIEKRYSTVNFSGELLRPEEIKQILEAARWSASCFNEQPWRFIIGDKSNSENYDKVLSCIGDGNKPWAKNAPLIVITLASKSFARNGLINKHAWHDVGLATSNMFTQALDLGIYSHPMAGFSSDKTRELFNVTDEFDPVAAIAFGRLGDENELVPSLLAREKGERKRKPLEDLIWST